VSADAWARRDACRIHSRVLRIVDTDDATDEELDYLRRQALFVVEAPGEMPAGWADDLRELVHILDEQIADRAEEA
jgi:hypothetical protein